jgi:hypothetical protein
LHGLKERPPGPQHIVGHKYGFILHVPQKLYLGDIIFQGVLGYPGIIPLFIQQGQGFFQGRGVEFIPGFVGSECGADTNSEKAAGTTNGKRGSQ